LLNPKIQSTKKTKRDKTKRATLTCHRVIGSNGELTGYAGGLKTKEKLLSLEQNQTQQKMEFV
jgi:alkylated DNA nucleotide flippase Atl1